MSRFALIIPTLNPGAGAVRLAEAIASQTARPSEIIIVDSSSTDGSLAAFEAIGATVRTITRSDFDHGSARNLGVELTTAPYVVFLTQDAIPADDRAFEFLVGALDAHPRAGTAYGRQIPHLDATVLAAHARGFNYPAVSEYRTIDDVKSRGVRAAFTSNSFAGYRREALAAVGGFPHGIIGSEDTCVAALMLHAGWGVAYCAEARVHHSHNYTVREEFSRYFDIGSFHAMERWYIELLGEATGEGMRFVQSELAALRAAGTPLAVIRCVTRNGCRWLGYRVGRMQRFLPNRLKSRIGMYRGYWSRQRRVEAPRLRRDHVQMAQRAAGSRELEGGVTP